MPLPRKALVSVKDTPWYHVTSRCVRRAFLCGQDHYTGRSYEHRKQWVIDRLQQLTSTFAIDVAAYAVMSNHYHLVVRIDVECAAGWSEDEVMERWEQLFSLPLVVERRKSGMCLTDSEKRLASRLIETWRERLSDLSWFLRCLNEPLARRANREDGCTGRFWEGRFRSQALLDEAAVLTAMAYVDLSPVRAGLARTPEHSKHTSLAQRTGDTPGPDLIPFLGDDAGRREQSIPFALADYLQLVDDSGRALRNDKKGFIAKRQPPILERLQIRPDGWMIAMRHHESRFPCVADAIDRIRRHAEHLGRRWLHGQSFASRLYATPT